MNPQTSLFSDVQKKINTMHLFSPVIVGPLPVGNGIAMQLATSRNDSIYYSHNVIYTINVLLLCKHDNQIVACDTLHQIGNYLQRGNRYPFIRDEYQWLKSEVTTGSQFVTQQENGKFIYSAVIDVTAHF